MPEFIADDYISITFNNNNLLCSYPTSKATLLSPKKYITPQIKFFIGKITQQITAAMTLTVLTNHYDKISFDELLGMKIQEIFPKSELLSNTTASWKDEVTLYDLLTGHSKLPNYLKHCKDLDFINTVVDPQLIFNALERLEDDAKSSIKDALYSNYYILAKLLEEFTHITYDELFKRTIKESLNLENSYAPVNGDISEFINKYEKFPIVNAHIETANLVGNANIISSTEDLVNFYEYIFHASDKASKLIKNTFYHEEKDVLIYGEEHINTKHYAEETFFAGHHMKIYHFQHEENEQNYLVLLTFNNAHEMPMVEHSVFE